MGPRIYWYGNEASEGEGKTIVNMSMFLISCQFLIYKAQYDSSQQSTMAAGDSQQSTTRTFLMYMELILAN